MGRRWTVADAPNFVNLTKGGTACATIPNPNRSQTATRQRASSDRDAGGTDAPRILYVLQYVWRPGRRTWEQHLWHSRTGRRLRELLLPGATMHVINACPQSPVAALPADISHAREQFDAFQPDVVVLLGVVAQGLRPHLEHRGAVIVEGPHPAARSLSNVMAALLRVAIAAAVSVKRAHDELASQSPPPRALHERRCVLSCLICPAPEPAPGGISTPPCEHHGLPLGADSAPGRSSTDEIAGEAGPCSRELSGAVAGGCGDLAAWGERPLDEGQR